MKVSFLLRAGAVQDHIKYENMAIKNRKLRDF